MFYGEQVACRAVNDSQNVTLYNAAVRLQA